MPRVSILLTAYNRAELLEKAIESVLAQTYKDYELIILDDNSSKEDHKQVLLKHWNTPRVLIVKSDVKQEDRKATVRYATMINYGLRIARGEFITYLCDDDYYFPQRLQRMVETLDANQDVNVVYGMQKLEHTEGGMELGSNTVRNPGLILENPRCVVDHSSIMHRKKVIDTVGYWNEESLWGDADGEYWERLGQAGFHFYPISEILDAHLYHAGSWTKSGQWEKLGTEEEPNR